MPINYTPKKEKQVFTGFSAKYTKKPVRGEVRSPIQTGYNPRETVKHPSLVTVGGETNLKSPSKYTGNEMLGITIIHKSCLQPVFNSQAAVDAASMRR
jgi:hypothetical protein